MNQCGMCTAEFNSSGGLSRHMGAKHKPDPSVEALTAAANRKGSLSGQLKAD